MEICEAQREVRACYAGGFWGQLIASLIWLLGAALGTWSTPKTAILTVVVAGFFLFPLTRLAVSLSGTGGLIRKENPFNRLGMQVALVLPFSMLLLVPVAEYRLNWFFPALMILLGAHYLPFATLYGMRMFLALGGALMALGVVAALYFSHSFSVGAWSAGVTLLVFAFVGRAASRQRSSSSAAG